MEELMGDIIDELKARGTLDAHRIDRIIAVHNKRFRDSVKHFAKKQLAPYYLSVKRDNQDQWESWGLSVEQERALLAAIQMKPRRTASGVATITVITKPHACAGNCIYCPNDVRMPKSYLHKEPACQRAERNYFDPYLQIASRLSALERMGHATDKVELIVLGGSFTDYPRSYQLWFARELFRALNDADEGFSGVGDVFARAHEMPDGKTETDQSTSETSPYLDEEPDQQCLPASSISQKATLRPSSLLARNAEERIELYVKAGIERDEEKLEAQSAWWQQQVNANLASYNDAVSILYGPQSPWGAVGEKQTSTLEEVHKAQQINEKAAHRVVGLVVETRPDAIDSQTLTLLRQLGCTKLQMGVQTIDNQVAQTCNRPATPDSMRTSFELVRAFGYKSHAHFMANLPGATPAGDKTDYSAFVSDPSFAPDELKLYPCALIGGTALERLHATGSWLPYTEDVLIDVLTADILATPAHTRISRMIRDFSSEDIVAGNKKTNLRQMVEQRVSKIVEQGAPAPQEIRMREIATEGANASTLELHDECYETSNTTEHFLQWVAPGNRIAGFLRLSLPHQEWFEAHVSQLPVSSDEAMIREVHVYGTAARLHAPTTGAQHQGLGRTLVERACSIAREAGYQRINVISAVGTRDYYRKLGFADNDLYLTREL